MPGVPCSPGAESHALVNNKNANPAFDFLQFSIFCNYCCKLSAISTPWYTHSLFLVAKLYFSKLAVLPLNNDYEPANGCSIFKM